MSPGRRASVLVENEAFADQISYTFDQLLSPLGLSFDVRFVSRIAAGESFDIVVSYGTARPAVSAAGQVHIYESDLFGSNYLQTASLPKQRLPVWNGLPVLFSGRGRLDSFVKKEDHLVETNIDIVAAVFFMLTCYEEVVVDARDRFGRFPVEESLAVREDFIERPIVNEYIELLAEWMESTGLQLKRPSPWRGKEFAVCCTHDVDRLRLFAGLRTILGTAWRALRRRSLHGLMRVIRDLAKTRLGLKKDPFDTFDDMLNLERELGLQSAYYFMAGGSARRYDGRYELSAVSGLIERIRDAGGEIGLHGSFNSLGDPELHPSERKALESVAGCRVTGNRQHYLRFRAPLTWRLLEAAGIEYDTTLGFSGRVGFRCGTCYPFQVYDVEVGRRLDLWEIPLTVMDKTLYGQEGGRPPLMLEKLRSLLASVERFGGVVVMLWHNGSFYEVERPGFRGVYEDALRLVHRKSTYCVTPREVLEAWKSTRELTK